MSLNLGVVIPLYNKRETVLKAVTAVLEQREPVAEIVVVDDGSTDGSVDELEPLLHQIKLIRQKNSGPSAARNRGIEELSTEWVAFADADNFWYPTRSEGLRRVITRYPEVQWLTGRYRCCYPDGKTITKPAVLTEDSSFDYFERRELSGSGLHCSETLAARRDVLLKIGGFCEAIRIYEITLMYQSLAASSASAGFVGDVTVDIFVDRPDSLYRSRSFRDEAAYARQLLALAERSNGHADILRRSAGKVGMSAARDAARSWRLVDSYRLRREFQHLATAKPS